MVLTFLFVYFFGPLFNVVSLKIILFIQFTHTIDSVYIVKFQELKSRYIGFSTYIFFELFFNYCFFDVQHVITL